MDLKDMGIDYKNLKIASNVVTVSAVHVTRRTTIEDITARIILKLNPFISSNISDSSYIRLQESIKNILIEYEREIKND